MFFLSLPSRLLALAGLCGDSRPSGDQDIPQRHRPSCQCCRETADTRDGHENRVRAVGESQNGGGRHGGRGWGHKPTEAIATGFCRCPEAQTPHPLFPQPPSIEPLLPASKGDLELASMAPLGSSSRLPCLCSPSRKQPPFSLPPNFLGSFSLQHPDVGFSPILGRGGGDKPKPHLQNRGKRLRREP